MDSIDGLTRPIGPRSESVIPMAEKMHYNAGLPLFETKRLKTIK